MPNPAQAALRNAIRAIEALKLIDQSRQSCDILSRGSKEWLAARETIRSQMAVAEHCEAKVREVAAAMERTQRERRRMQDIKSLVAARA